jgi:hypothetical protein
VNERRLLQIVVALGSLVSICAGAAGIVLGPAMVDAGTVPAAADSHYRYLSGLLFGIGIAFATTIPAIERRTARFRLLTAIVVIGGLGRLCAVVMRGYPGKPMAFALVMELVVTPTLALWQARIARQGAML